MRIEQTATFLSALAKDVANGLLVPAAFQRPYVWSKQDVLALCESITQRIPVGSFLLWLPCQEVDRTKVGRARLGPISIDGNVQHARMLLDGQNRLATIAWMFRNEDEPLPSDLSEMERQTWNSGDKLVVNLLERRIEFAPAADAEGGFRMPARALLDTQFGMRVMRKQYDQAWSQYSPEVRDEGLKFYDAVSYAFREARVAVTSLENATPAEARKAFLAICKVGVPMSSEDFDRAIAWAL